MKLKLNSIIKNVLITMDQVQHYDIKERCYGSSDMCVNKRNLFVKSILSSSVFPSFLKTEIFTKVQNFKSFE